MECERVSSAPFTRCCIVLQVLYWDICKSNSTIALLYSGYASSARLLTVGEASHG